LLGGGYWDVPPPPPQPIPDRWARLDDGSKQLVLFKQMTCFLGMVFLTVPENLFFNVKRVYVFYAKFHYIYLTSEKFYLCVAVNLCCCQLECLVVDTGSTVTETIV